MCDTAHCHPTGPRSFSAFMHLLPAENPDVFQEGVHDLHVRHSTTKSYAPCRFSMFMHLQAVPGAASSEP